MASNMNGGFATNGEGAVRHQHPHRPSQQYPKRDRGTERHNQKAISVITWIEVMVGAVPDVEAATRDLLGNFRLVGLDDRIADLAARLRRAHRIKLPDAIIWASAQAEGMLLVTRNTKDFPESDPGVRVPYRI